MLYKKYHRNFVNQFKKGIKFRHRSLSTEVVEEEPYYYDSRICIAGSMFRWTLVYSDGQLTSNTVEINII